MMTGGRGETAVSWHNIYPHTTNTWGSSNLCYALNQSTPLIALTHISNLPIIQNIKFITSVVSYSYPSSVPTCHYFQTKLPTVAPEQRLGLIIYTAVIIYSGLLAAYYLFMHKPTRAWP